LILASDAGTQFCSATLGVFTAFPTTQAGITSGCIAARDLEADGSLTAYNPGWQQLTGAHWVGFTVNGGPSSDYRPTPGIYAFQETFTLPAGVTNPTLSLDVRADNVVAVYLNGTKLGQQTMQDCNDGEFGPCYWTSGGTLHVSATSGFVANPGLNYLTFLVADVPTGYPDLTAPFGGASPQYGCTTRLYQATGTVGFTSTTVNTSPDHIGPHPTGPGNPMTPTPVLDTPNPTQDGCENPSGLAFAGTITWTPPATLQWCSPGFWKNHYPDAWGGVSGSLLYKDMVVANKAPLSKKAGAGANPTIYQVISDPSTYGGPATNSVADYLSGIIFGANVGTSADDARCNGGVPLAQTHGKSAHFSAQSAPARPAFH